MASDVSCVIQVILLSDTGQTSGYLMDMLNKLKMMEQSERDYGKQQIGTIGLILDLRLLTKSGRINKMILLPKKLNLRNIWFLIEF